MRGLEHHLATTLGSIGALRNTLLPVAKTLASKTTSIRTRCKPFLLPTLYSLKQRKYIKKTLLYVSNQVLYRYTTNVFLILLFSRTTGSHIKTVSVTQRIQHSTL
jgi:hypothetical protein